MGKPLPVDLRERVVGAVDEGQSRRKEAERFGVSISSAIRSGPACGGGRARCSPSARCDKRVGRIEAHRPLILPLVAAKADHPGGVAHGARRAGHCRGDLHALAVL